MRNVVRVALAFLGLGLAIASVDGQIMTPERYVQISSVDFGTGVLTLTNFGPNDQSLDGWRFCSHDENELRRYSSVSGLNGITLAPGETLSVHFNNDASGVDEINASTIGGAFAQPLDQMPASGGAYGIQIYFVGSFGNGNFIADHIQWSYDGFDSTNADERSDEAEVGGVWADQSNWISVDASTRAILLDPGATDNETNSPADYSTVVVGVNDIEPSDVTVFRGIVVAGGLAETTQSDDAILGVNPGFTLNSSEAPVSVIHDGVLPLSGAIGLDMIVEARANTVGLTQTIEAFNWMTSEFEELDSRPGSFNVDSVTTINLDIATNVYPGSGEVRVRTGWRASGFVLLFPWQVSVDQVVLRAEY